MVEMMVVDARRNNRILTKVIYPGDLIVDLYSRIYRFEYAIRPNAAHTSGKIAVTDLEFPNYILERYTDNFGLAVLRREGDAFVE